MIYNVTGEFTRSVETAGTIQNNSYIYPIEISKIISAAVKASTISQKSLRIVTSPPVNLTDEQLNNVAGGTMGELHNDTIYLRFECGITYR